ncbi:hypothetical protein K7X08_002741 [Anisodus acutangulus]|uniref:Uncharacterized protein n=1 Tax=Anisodus acutangulus TaxID=402998 RepID=A0A9Q1RI21_9SOLA|nr:hypothetical protein K7X08_002741 [Anisodus acutangulus]
MKRCLVKAFNDCIFCPTGCTSKMETEAYCQRIHIPNYRVDVQIIVQDEKEEQVCIVLYGDDFGKRTHLINSVLYGGGIPESKRASELSEFLGVNILPSQVMLGHSPFMNLLKRFENELIVVTGKGEPAEVMSAYGFKKDPSLEEYASYFDDIDPVAQFKRWTRTTKPLNWSRNSSELVAPHVDVLSDRVKAVFVASDPVDWGRDIQVLCDILTSGGLPGKENPFVFQNAGALLRNLQVSCQSDDFSDSGDAVHVFRTLYMIGGNPFVDIKGAQQAGHPWFSILIRTGVFKDRGNHAEFPADLG